MNLNVSEKTRDAPHKAAKTHAIQSHSPKTENGRPTIPMMIAEVIRVDHWRYQETTESLNLLIFRIAIYPPAERKGVVIKRM